MSLGRNLSRWLALLGASLMMGFSAPCLRADERLKDIACRSVHLSYPLGEGLAFYHEVKVERSAPGTYFMVCGWRDGYFGIQERFDGGGQIIFSVWDSFKTDDPAAVPDGQRVLLVHRDPEVRVGRFGGEGTGGQSFLNYAWKPGQTYRFLVSAKPAGRRTEFTGWFFHPEQKAWRKLVTFSTITEGRSLAGYYAFIEDFKRDRRSTEQLRRASFGNGWVLGRSGDWQPARGAKFTADRNPVLNIDAGVAGGRFFLATGGKIENRGTQLGATMSLPEAAPPPKPADLPSLDPDRPAPTAPGR